MTHPLIRTTASILSPLRYPGGKRRLVGYVAEALRLNGQRPAVYVEPFAGGASVALQLLNDGLVERAVLGERDPLVAAFWRVVFSDPERLIRDMERADVSVAAWERMRAYHPRSDRGKALKCFYLNRTSFSGILADTAGPIGGKAQASAYGIGCRFPKARLAQRIRQAAALADRVALVHEGDWAATLAVAQALATTPEELFVYLDPPFYRKADRLYRHHFDAAAHERLADGVARLRDQGVPLLLSYDDADAIAALYEARGFAPGRVELMYSAIGKAGPARAPELVVSTIPRLPGATRLWRTSGEWRASGDGAADGAPALATRQDRHA
ncbi:MAG: DNA adenine methylase [Bacteroidota bacterium]